MINNLFQKYLTTKNIIFFVILILFLIFISKIQDIVLMFFASYVIACSMEPIVKFFSKKFSRVTSAGITVTLMILFVCAFFIPLIVISGLEIRNFAITLPDHIENIKAFLGSIPMLKNSNLAQVDIGGMISSVSNVTTNVVNETIIFGKNIGSAFIYLIVSIIIIYYFMADKKLLNDTFLHLFPTPMRKKAKEISDSISQKVGGYVIAQLTTMAGVGIIMAVGLMLLRVDYALLLGLITAILDIVPIVGPTLALIICLAAVYKCGALALVLVVVIFGFSQFAENNFIRPYVFGKFLDLHPLIIFLALFICAKYLGVVGVIFAPAIAATTVVLIQELYMKNLE